MYVIPLSSALTNMVIFSGEQDPKMKLNGVISLALMKAEDLNPKLYDQILIPSFKQFQTNFEYSAKGVYGGLHMENAIQSAKIELISGLSANMGLKMNDSYQVQKVDTDFIFAISDQNLQNHKLQNPLIIVADVTKAKWIKI